MSSPLEPPAVGRGARKRQSQHEKLEREEARRWLLQPAVLLFLGVLVLAALGWGLVIQATRRIPARQATLDGVEVRLERASWIEDQMEHGENYQKPTSMMPDLPEPGLQRVTLNLALRNRAGAAREFQGDEFRLVPEIGKEVPPFGALVGEAHLAPGQTLNTAIHFDLNTTRPHGRLVVKWQQGHRAAYFPVPEPPEHFHLRPRGGEVALPTDARLLLPIGDPGHGEQLYTGVYACGACHGDPKAPGSNNIGPHLGGIGLAGGTRISGKSAAQYIYESILSPDAFIAPQCKDGRPCEQPSAMPEYSSLINLQDAADLLTYLLQQQAAPAPAGAAGAGP